jgi:membrane-associated protein
LTVLSVSPILAADLAANWGRYLLLFLAVSASWAGVPFIGAATISLAAAAASQGQLNLAAVIVIASVAGEVGGLLGYAIGFRFGRQILERPGKRQESRRRIVERGEQAYAKWGRLAVFVTPAIVSGTARMQHGQFVIWNAVASLGFALSVAPSAYGLGRVASGHNSLRDILILVFGVVVGALVVTLSLRHRRRLQTSSSS